MTIDISEDDCFAYLGISGLDVEAILLYLLGTNFMQFRIEFNIFPLLIQLRFELLSAFSRYFMLRILYNVLLHNVTQTADHLEFCLCSGEV